MFALKLYGIGKWDMYRTEGGGGTEEVGMYSPPTAVELCPWLLDDDNALPVRGADNDPNPPVPTVLLFI